MIKHKIKHYDIEEHTDYHSHQEHQLVYVHSGLCVSQTEGKNYYAVNGQALWIPANESHSAIFFQDSRLSLLFFDRPPPSPLTTKPALFRVTNFWSLLMYEYSLHHLDFDNNTQHAYNDVLWDQIQYLSQIQGSQTHTNHFDKRLNNLIHTVCLKPNKNITLQDFAKHCGASERTLNRLFYKQFHRSFGEWRNMIVMERANQMLIQGLSATNIALELGYQSLPTFSSALKRYNTKGK
ncbi:AraC family transcriptional regulator [Vibrio lentus]